MPFDAAVAPGGYAWWYLDALSDWQPDGSQHALTAIVFIGSVFSPYYAWARRRAGAAGAPAEHHCAVNVALYRRQAGQASFQTLWAMTERGAGAILRDRLRLRIGPSQLAWTEAGLLLTVNERCAPWPRPLRGQVLLQPRALPARQFALDDDGLHLWQPIAPQAQVQVNFEAPALRWQGPGYLDSNHGSRPLADDFQAWDWSRSTGPDGLPRLHYDRITRDGAFRPLALRLDAHGQLCTAPGGLLQALPRSAWGLDRRSRIDPACSTLVRMEDGPFYSRSLLTPAVPGSVQHGVHERLDLRRFSAAWVQAMLPFRMPRRGG